jgi:hypothetical protein
MRLSLIIEGVLRIPADQLLLEDARDISEWVAALPGRCYPARKWISDLSGDDDLSTMAGIL